MSNIEEIKKWWEEYLVQLQQLRKLHKEREESPSLYLETCSSEEFCIIVNKFLNQD